MVLRCTVYDLVRVSAADIDFDREDPFTISAWVKLHPLSAFMEIFHRIGSKYKLQNGFDVALKNGKLNVRLAHALPDNLIEIRSVKEIPNDVWQHIAIAYDGSGRAEGLNIFLNGEQVEKEVIFDQLTQFISHDAAMSVGGAMHLDEHVDDGAFFYR